MSFRTRSVIVRLATLSGAIALGVIAVEGTIRLAGLDQPLIWRPHPVLGWSHIPGAEAHWREEGNGLIQINRQGMRDVERNTDKSPAAFRIAVFGDSMTEGVQVNLDQAFTQLLERNLTAAGRTVEVLNFGVNGYSPLQEYLLYRDLGATFAPDLVIQAVFLDNDVADSHPALATNPGTAPRLRASEGSLLDVDYSGSEASSREYASQPIATIREWSALYRFASHTRATLAARSGGDQPSATIPRRYQMYLASPDPAWNQAWRNLERVVTAFSGAVASSGARFAIVSLPAGQIVNDAAWEALLAANEAMRAQSWALDLPEQRLREMASRANVPLLVTTPHFRSRPIVDKLFFGRVGHFTPDGHRVMADLLKNWLIEQGLLPNQR
jgi:lysophospholipase L1-like esterase